MFLAYKYVALAVMLAEINFCSGRLHLSDNKPPLRRQDCTAIHIDAPSDFIKFAGLVTTKESFSFSFVKSARLRYVVKLDNQGRQSFGIPRGEDETIVSCLERLSHMKSMINSNDAYRLGTNWLVAMGADLKRLEAEHPPVVEQQLWKSSPGGDVPIPLFYIWWGDDAASGVHVMISGLTGELLNLCQDDDSYSKRPSALIKDVDQLLAIPDEEFLKYSDLERSNLVVRFAAIQYPPLGKTNDSPSP